MATASNRGAKGRKKVERTAPWSNVPFGKPIAGIDPGARNTGFVILQGEVVLYAETIHRPDEMEQYDYADYVCDEIGRIISEVDFFDGYEVRFGIEGISDPKGFHNGKRAAINPRDIIRASAVFGAIRRDLKLKGLPYVIIEPKGNGSNHISQYPPSLTGTRPADLPGSGNKSGTRNHERSAFDVAIKAIEAFKFEGDK